MKKAASLFFILATVLFSNAQMITPPYRYFVITDPVTVSNPADHFFYAHNYLKAAEVYESLLAKEGSSDDLLFNLAGVYSLAGKTDSAFAKLAKLAENGFFNIDYFQRNTDLVPLHTMPQWEQIEAKILSNLKIFEERVHISQPEIRRQLLNLATIDQFTDQVLFLQRAYNAYPEYDTAALHKNKLAVYRNGTEVIKQLTEKYGVLGKSKVGNDGAEAFWTIVQHSDHDLATQQKILSLMAEALKNDEFTRIQFAFLTDRVLKNKHEPQLYGTQYWKNPTTGKFEIYTLKNPKKTDKLRKEMGLPSLEENNRAKIH